MHVPATRIRRLRARVPHQDPVAARRDLERLLIACESPSNLLAPGAILCIREIRDPLPHTLRLGGDSLRPPARWREALDRQWAGILTAAARPIRGSVPASAPAVLFGSEAELLACLAIAATGNRLAGDWWWAGLLRADELEDWLLRWRRRPSAVPGAVTLLAAQGILRTVADRIPPESARSLLEIMIRDYGIMDLSGYRPGEGRDMASRGQAGTVEKNAAEAPDSAPVRGATSSVIPSPPWCENLCELRDWNAPPSVRAWIALALLLERAPGVVRKRAFAKELTSWVSHSVHGDVPAFPNPAGASLIRSVLPSGKPTESATLGTPVSPTAAVLTPRAVLPLPGPTMSPGIVGSLLSAPEVVRWETAERPADAANTPLMGLHPDSSEGIAVAPSPREVPACYPRSAARFQTQFGGCFYLLNVALSLGVYGDFTQPLKPGLELSPWDLLALLAGRGLGAEFDDDPLARFLAVCAGRSEHEAPGAHFDPPAEGASLVGFNPPEPGSRPSPLALCPLPLPSSSREPPRLSSWLDGVTPQFEARLRLALPSWDSSPVLSRLLRQRAEVETFDRTIRVRFALEDHPLPVRMAGLDRDPGWIPAAGWSVAFLFRNPRELTNLRQRREMVTCADTAHLLRASSHTPAFLTCGLKPAVQQAEKSAVRATTCPARRRLSHAPADRTTGLPVVR